MFFSTHKIYKLKTLFLISTLVLSVSIISCNNETGSQSSSPRISNSSINSKTGLPIPNSTNTALTNLNPEHGKPGHRCEIAVGAPLTDPTKNIPIPAIIDTTVVPDKELIKAATTTTTTAAPGMNPQHGQPGHRCEIAVGAPLNSTVKANTTQASTATNIPANSSPVKTTATTVAPGMNPQHGQPGHRCDVAVGSPLADTAKNKASQASTSQTIANTQITNTSATNATTNFVEKPAENTVTTVVPGMNPKHGEPGHRCDIAVGAPLNSKPKQ